MTLCLFDTPTAPFRTRTQSDTPAPNIGRSRPDGERMQTGSLRPALKRRRQRAARIESEDGQWDKMEKRSGENALANLKGNDVPYPCSPASEGLPAIFVCARVSPYACSANAESMRVFLPGVKSVGYRGG